MEGRPIEAGPALEGYPGELGLALEDRPVEHRPALEDRFGEPGLALEDDPVEPSHALEDRFGEPGLALEDNPIEPGLTLKGRLIELGGSDGRAVILAWYNAQQPEEQLGADDHSAGIDRALLSDALELSVNGVGGLFGGVGEAQGRGRESDADATVFAARRPICFVVCHG
jgi:hypothetical protein